MVSDKAYVGSVVEALAPLNVRSRAMFGEYGLYCDDKVVGFICDNQLLLKPLDPPVAAVKELPMAEAYPGSKLYHLVPNDALEADWLKPAVQETAARQPVKVKKAKKR